MDTTTYQAISAIAEAHRALAVELEALLGTHYEEPRTPALIPGQDAVADVWDPEVDAPLVPPKVVGTREEQDWCCLTYLGGIYAINKRYNRGASASEVRSYALKAGYRDGRAVTAWSKGNGATQNDAEKQRWVNANGVDYWVKGLAGKLGLTLPADLAEPWEAPDFSRHSTTASENLT